MQRKTHLTSGHMDNNNGRKEGHILSSPNVKVGTKDQELGQMSASVVMLVVKPRLLPHVTSPFISPNCHQGLTLDCENAPLGCGSLIRKGG